jgi:PilZ domain-containing protein
MLVTEGTTSSGSAPKGGADKRLFKRFKVQVRVRIAIVRAAGNLLVYGQGTDVSEGGIAIFVPQELEPGQALNLELMLPYSKDKLALNAVVRSKSGFRYGVEFVRLSATERHLITRTCNTLSLLQ